MADFVIALREERDRLQKRIQVDQETVATIEELLRRYEGAGTPGPIEPPETPSPPPPNGHLQPFVRSETGMYRVLEATAGYLRSKGAGARAQSPEILGEMVRLGLMRRDQGQVLSSYLSRSKEMFDNKRGQGYGLKE